MNHLYNRRTLTGMPGGRKPLPNWEELWYVTDLISLEGIEIYFEDTSEFEIYSEGTWISLSFTRNSSSPKRLWCLLAIKRLRIMSFHEHL